MFSSRTLKTVFITALAVFSFAGAQGPLTAGMDTFHFETKVGSFKMVGSGPSAPPDGRLEINFTGTLLITRLKTDIQVTGNVKKEYEDVKHNKVAYFGTGKIVVTGTFLSAQWFGRDMDATFKGKANIRLYGEFDKDLNTGKCWYLNQADKKIDWGTGGKELSVPLPQHMRPIVPTVRTGS